MQVSHQAAIAHEYNARWRLIPACLAGCVCCVCGCYCDRSSVVHVPAPRAQRPSGLATCTPDENAGCDLAQADAIAMEGKGAPHFA
jgi:hypothetical protein